MLKKSLFLIVFIHSLICANAQIKDKIVAPQFLFPVFTEGFVYLKSAVINTPLLNFNTLNEEMLFKKDTDTLKLDMPGKIDSIVIDNRVFIQKEAIFYEQIAGNKLKLLVRNRSRWEPEGQMVGYGTSKLAKSTEESMFVQGGSIAYLDRERKIDFFDDSWYYFSLNNNIVEASKLKNFYDFFPNLKSKIKQYTTQNKLNLRSKNDLIKLVDFINMQL